MKIRNKAVEIEVVVVEMDDDDDVKVDFYNENNNGVPDSPNMMRKLWSFPNREDQTSFEELMEFLEDMENIHGKEYYRDELDMGHKYELVNGELEVIGYD